MIRIYPAPPNPREAVFRCLVCLAEAQTYHDPDRFLADLSASGFAVVRSADLPSKFDSASWGWNYELYRLRGYGLMSAAIHAVLFTRVRGWRMLWSPRWYHRI